MADHEVALRHDIPSSARVANVLLGGKDNYEIDRIVAADVSKRFVVALREGRRFLLRAVEYLSREHAVHQYVELGCGIALPPDVGDAATHRGESARVLYLDHDVLVAAHAHALLAHSPNRRFALADITDTCAVLDQIAGLFDLGQPLAICLSGTAELLPDAPAMLMELTSALHRAAGSSSATSPMTCSARTSASRRPISRSTPSRTGHATTRPWPTCSPRTGCCRLASSHPIGGGPNSAAAWVRDFTPSSGS